MTPRDLLACRRWATPTSRSSEPLQELKIEDYKLTVVSLECHGEKKGPNVVQNSVCDAYFPLIILVVNGI